MFSAAAPSDWVMATALSIPRMAGVFLVMPLFTEKIVPATVRNSLFVVLSFAVVPTVLAQQPAALFEGTQWMFIIMKEAFIGVAIGFSFAAIFWALNVAGGVVDTQSGGNFSSAIDPLQGTQTTISSQWLTQMAVTLFFASGALLLLLDVLFRSYVAWPVLDFWPSLERAGMMLFIDEFEYIMTRGILLAAPVMLALSLVDFAFGLVNRYAQQMNVLQFSLAVKSWLQTWMFLLVLAVFIEMLVRHWEQSPQIVRLLDAAL